MAGGWAIRPGLDEFLTRTDDFIHPPIWLVRRELFEAAGWFDEQHRTMEHYDMALRLASLTQWRFLDGGPVARGRFSKKSKWYSNIVNGTNEQLLPRIIENALTRLPTTPEGDATRRKARAAVCATIAGQKMKLKWPRRVGQGLRLSRPDNYSARCSPPRPPGCMRVLRAEPGL